MKFAPVMAALGILVDATETTTQCREDGCGGDPDDGEGWDGFCGNCADRCTGETKDD